MWVTEISSMFVTTDTLKRRNPVHRGYVGGTLCHLTGTHGRLGNALG